MTEIYYRIDLEENKRKKKFQESEIGKRRGNETNSI